MLKIGRKQNLDALHQLGGLHCISQAMFTAFTLKIFDHISDRQKTLQEINQQLHYHAESLDRLLALLASLKVIKKNGRFYKHYKHLQQYLVSTSPNYIGDIYALYDEGRKKWSTLSDLVKTGIKEEPLPSKNPEKETEFFQKAMRSKNVFFAANVVKKIVLESPSTLLELCVGPTSYTVHFLKNNPDLTVKALDLPTTIPISKKLFDEALREEPEAESITKRAQFIASNIFEYDFPPSDVEAVFYGDALHIWDTEENQKIFNNIFTTLKQGGKVYIYDFFMNDKGTAPLSSLLFHNHMNLFTNNGKVYSFKEVKKMLVKAGFSAIKCQRTEKTDHTLIEACKKGK
ncbi:MAG: methyltransferase domain-containing protein [Nitrospinae bacterium]|nr:methyltransferase domain-containing protein [Nitrospinota bacterium]